MPDQFDKTISSVGGDAYVRRPEYQVDPAEGAAGKRVEPEKDDDEEREEKRRRPYSELSPPDPDLWGVLIEALDRFNKHQDMRRSPYDIRLWAQNDGFRVQLIMEETGELIKQTSLLPFEKTTRKELNEIVNDLISERGIVLDITR